MLKKIISGGQTGADQGGLHGAKLAGLATGGTTPRGWRTETGPRQDLKHYNLTQSQSSSYIPRTRKNIKDSDGTLIFGNIMSPGNASTARVCEGLRVPYLAIPFIRGETLSAHILLVIAWINLHGVETLNIAGNRESKNPGIHDAVSNFIVELISELEKESCKDKASR